MTHRHLVPLLFLFGSLYFVQGIVEPSACLPAQPVQTELRLWGLSPGEIGRFFGLISLAWVVKPLFGLISDYLPLGGRRRKPYLLLAALVTAGAFFALAESWGSGGSSQEVSRAEWLLLMGGLGVACLDVVIDALGVEEGQRLGITGQIQAVQWGGLSVAGLIIGSLGGYVAEQHLQRSMFAGCGLLMLVSLVIVLLVVREPQRTATADVATRQIWPSGRLATMVWTAAFLFLWNFNPFSNNVLQEYATRELHFSEQFYGHLGSIQAAGNVLACGGYFLVCRRIPRSWMIQGSIVAGILSTAAYWLFFDAWTAVGVSLLFGTAYQLGLLIQLDLAARVCPTESAGTAFAVLMAVSNCGVYAGVYLGGGWYEGLAVTLGSKAAAFYSLVAIGAAFTAGCWLLVPLMGEEHSTGRE